MEYKVFNWKFITFELVDAKGSEKLPPCALTKFITR